MGGSNMASDNPAATPEIDAEFERVMAEIRDNPMPVAKANGKKKAKKGKGRPLDTRLRNDYLRSLGLDPNDRLPNGQILKVRNAFGLKPEIWDNLKMRTIAELGHFSTVKISARMLAVFDFTSFQQLSRCIEIAKDMMEDDKGTPEEKDNRRLAAGSMMTKAVEALGGLSEQIVELLEKGIDKPLEIPGATRPPNLPPPVAVQVNNYPTGQTAGVVTSPATPALVSSPPKQLPPPSGSAAAGTGKPIAV